MSTEKVAIVTGANKGIGYAIVKGLCEKFPGVVYLTARDEKRGLEAVKSLNEIGLHPQFHQLDITDNQSILKFRDYLQFKYGGIDVLVNNAAIAYKVNSTVPFAIQAKETIRVNYHGTKAVCDVFRALFRPHARIVMVSSSAGHLSRIPSESIRKELASEFLQEVFITAYMDDFVDAAEKGLHEVDWGTSAYAVSKIGVTALARVMQKSFLLGDPREDVVVNAVHPGYVATDMSSHKGNFTIDQGAEAPLYAALLPPNIYEPRGEFIWCNKEVVDWTTSELKVPSS